MGKEPSLSSFDKIIHPYYVKMYLDSKFAIILAVCIIFWFVVQEMQTKMQFLYKSMDISAIISELVRGLFQACLEIERALQNGR